MKKIFVIYAAVSFFFSASLFAEEQPKQKINLNEMARLAEIIKRNEGLLKNPETLKAFARLAQTFKEIEQNKQVNK